MSSGEGGAAAVSAAQPAAVKAELKAHRDALWGEDTGDGGVMEDQSSEVTAREKGGEGGVFASLGGWVGVLAIASTSATVAMVMQSNNFPGMLWGGAGSGV
jgi:hypothetical protein